jgi:uncharacterized membrane protein
MTSVIQRPIPPPAAEPGSNGSFAALLLGLAGGALVASRRSWPRHAQSAATVAGLALIGAAAQRPLSEALRRAGTRRRSAEVRTSFVVSQPVERVFAFCRDFENYTRFIGALREVRDYGDGRSHWCAATRSGKTVEWDTVTTKYVPNKVIAWHTVGRAPVESTGLIRFHPEGDGTCVHIVLTYCVNESRMGDAVAALLTPARSKQLEADIRRLALFLDTASESELVGSGL